MAARTCGILRSALHGDTAVLRFRQRIIAPYLRTAWRNGMRAAHRSLADLGRCAAPFFRSTAATLFRIQRCLYGQQRRACAGLASERKSSAALGSRFALKILRGIRAGFHTPTHLAPCLPSYPHLRTAGGRRRRGAAQQRRRWRRAGTKWRRGVGEKQATSLLSFVLFVRFPLVWLDRRDVW